MYFSYVLLGGGRGGGRDFGGGNRDFGGGNRGGPRGQSDGGRPSFGDRGGRPDRGGGGGGGAKGRNKIRKNQAIILISRKNLSS